MLQCLNLDGGVLQKRIAPLFGTCVVIHGVSMLITCFGQHLHNAGFLLGLSRGLFASLHCTSFAILCQSGWQVVVCMDARLLPRDMVIWLQYSTSYESPQAFVCSGGPVLSTSDRKTRGVYGVLTRRLLPINMHPA